MKRGDNLRKYDHSGPTYRTRPAEYRAWTGMKQRCTNPRFKDWRLYGGRGISVCPQWLESFDAFFNDVGPKPSQQHSLDRHPNGDGNYELGNVRWATSKQQARNWTHRNKLFEHKGERLTLSEWAERLGLARESLRDRIKTGWDIGRALSVRPVRQRERDARGVFTSARH